MTIKYLKKASKTASTDDTKTKDIVQNLLKELEKSKEEGCKELTKKFEEHIGNNINDVLMYFKDKEVLGEITLVIKGRKKEQAQEFNKSLRKKWI